MIQCLLNMLSNLSVYYNRNRSVVRKHNRSCRGNENSLNWPRFRNVNANTDGYVCLTTAFNYRIESWTSLSIFPINVLKIFSDQMFSYNFLTVSSHAIVNCTVVFNLHVESFVDKQNDVMSHKVHFLFGKRSFTKCSQNITRSSRVNR